MKLLNQTKFRALISMVSEKLLSKKTLFVLMVILTGSAYIISCKKANDPLPTPANNNPVINRGSAIFLPGNMTAGVATEWKLDKVHSSVLWSTSYVGAAGLLTGRFNQFGMHDVTTAEMINYVSAGQPVKDTSWAFYENDPTKTFFSGYVQINQSNTGEPGRDAGCNVAGMGTTAIVAGTQNLTVTNLAQIKTTKIELDPNSADYIVTLNLTWQGKLGAPLTKSIVGKLKYWKRATVGVAPATYDVFGLQLKFQFNCRDYGITSTSIADVVAIECNMNFNNK
jgi:polyisoprenoid-binding protein YceI